MKLKETGICFYCMGTGSIKYQKSGLGPFPAYKYNFYAKCPMCESGRGKGWMSFSDIFDAPMLERVREMNLKKYGDLEAESPDGMEQKVKTFIQGIFNGQQV